MKGMWVGYDVGCTMGLTCGHGAWQIDRQSSGSMWNSYSFQPVGQWMSYSFTDLGAEGCCRSLNALFSLNVVDILLVTNIIIWNIEKHFDGLTQDYGSCIANPQSFAKWSICSLWLQIRTQTSFTNFSHFMVYFHQAGSHSSTLQDMLPGGHVYVVDEVVYFFVVVIFQLLSTIHSDRYDYTIEVGRPVSVCINYIPRIRRIGGCYGFTSKPPATRRPPPAMVLTR